MSTKEPELQDFGITPKDYALYISKGNVDVLDKIQNSVLVQIVFGVVFVATLTVFIVAGNGGGVLVVVIFVSVLWVVTLVIAWLIIVPARKIKLFRLQRSPIGARIKLYEEALVKYNLAEEGAEIRRYSAENPDAPEMTDEDWASARPANQEMKEPELHDFGVTSEDYDLYYNKGDEHFPSGLSVFFFLVVVPLFVFSIAFIITKNWYVALWWGILGGPFLSVIAGGIVTGLVSPAIVRFKHSRLLKRPVASRIKLYEEALATYRAAKEEAERQQREAERARWEAEERRQEAERLRQRKFEQYWIDMDGIGFERELGGLFRTMGYGVSRTPTSGDQGVDLVLRKNGVTTVVQCKAHKNGVGPAVVRELYGSMTALRADNAILACTGGFTKGVHKFVEGKPIRLLDASAIARMAEGVAMDEIAEGVAMDEISQETRSQPKCPNCRRQMVLRSGRNGEFWGCSAFPNCRGTRRI